MCPQSPTGEFKKLKHASTWVLLTAFTALACSGNSTDAAPESSMPPAAPQATSAATGGASTQPTSVLPSATTPPGQPVAPSVSSEPMGPGELAEGQPPASVPAEGEEPEEGVPQVPEEADVPQAPSPAEEAEPSPVEDGATEQSVPSLIGDVTFSVPSQTFEGELTVGLESETVGAEIRYTTDGTLPSAESTLYEGQPLVLTETTQLRALAYLDGAVAGLDSTAIYIQRTFDFSSDIPIVILEGYGGGKPEDKENYIDLAFMAFEPAEGIASLSSLPDVATRAGYRLRGQSSANFEKAPYRVELWDNAGDDADYPLLGMPAEADWAMIGPYTDRSLIRNAFVYSLSRDMGLVAMDLRFAEVFINQDGGPLEESDYEGIYAVTQTIKNQKSRVDLKQLEPEDVDETAISGGYIFKFDQAAVDDDETIIECTGSELFSTRGGFGQVGNDEQDEEAGHCWSDLELVDPDPVNDEQLTYISSYLQEFHDALHTEPLGDYASLIDMGSFVDHFIINEITRDVDAYIRSHYYHKDREMPLKAGPIWDYNFSLGNFSTDLEGWQWEDGRRGTNDWFQRLANDPVFIDQVSVRWRELRQGLLSDAEVSARIDTIAAPLTNAAPRDLERWPVGETSVGGFGGRNDTEAAPADWPGQVSALLEWTIQRMAWLDTQL